MLASMVINSPRDAITIFQPTVGRPIAVDYRRAGSITAGGRTQAACASKGGRTPMHAVLIEIDVSGVDEDEGLKGLREQIVPAITALPGFQSGTWLTGNEHGLGLSLTVWDSQQHAEAMASMFGPGSSPQAGASIRRCEVRVVAALA
jgi:hypothetical protein